MEAYANKVTWHVIAKKKFKTKNGNSLCFKSFKFVTIRLVKMVKRNKLCFAFVKSVIGFKIYGILYWCPVPQ